MKKILLYFAIQINAFAVFAQQPVQLADSVPTNIGGFQAGYDIRSESEKEVGNKGNFSRYKIHFFVTNTTNEAKIIVYKPNSSVFGSGTSPDIAQFKCLNATGARFTSKEFTLQAKQCIIDALVDETDAAGKTKQVRKPASIGYWVKPGETLSSNSIVIVPLNEKPNITVTFYPGSTSMGASIINNNAASNNTQYVSHFIHIKNTNGNIYLHNQHGPLECSAITNGWWSAEWEIIPVNGTNYFLIKNHWKNNFISTNNMTMLSEDGNSKNSEWSVEETGGNFYTIRNAGNNAKLILDNGTLKASSSYTASNPAQWIIGE